MSAIHYIREGMEVVQQYPQISAIVGATALGMAFSKRVRGFILRRDGGCQWEYETGENDSCMGGLEAAHIDHDRNNPDYDHPDNGRAFCTKHHGRDHELNEGQNGLTIEQNRWSIGAIALRLSTFVDKNS